MIGAIILCGAMCVPPPSGTDVDGIMRAIAKVESNHKDSAIGDGGKAIGRYQIHKVYWQDAVQYDPSIGGKYEDCTDPVYARKVVVAYLSRYAPNWNLDTVSGIHNGGPKGHTRSATEGYRNKVRKAYNGK
jgi:hypothetical protein